MTDLAFQYPMLPLHRTAKCLVTLSAHLRAHYFVGTEASPNAWKVYRDVAAQGDCFYDCVTRAHNSAQANPGALLSLGELRQRISGSLDEGDFEARVDFYVAMAASEANVLDSSSPRHVGWKMTSISSVTSSSGSYAGIFPSSIFWRAPCSFAAPAPKKENEPGTDHHQRGCYWGRQVLGDRSAAARNGRARLYV